MFQWYDGKFPDPLVLKRIIRKNIFPISERKPEDINKIEKLIRKITDDAENIDIEVTQKKIDSHISSYNLDDEMSFIRFALSEAKEFLEAFKAFTSSLRNSEDIKIVLARSIYLSECRINFVDSPYPLAASFEKLILVLDDINSNLDEFKEDEMLPYKVINIAKTLKKSVAKLKLLLELRYRFANLEDGKQYHETNSDYNNSITLEELCLVSPGRKNPKSFYILIESGELIKTGVGAVTLISAIKWYKRKGYNKYSELPLNGESEVLLRMLF